MSCHIQFCAELAVAQDLYQVTGTNQPCNYHIVYGDGCGTALLAESLESRYIDYCVFYSCRVLEAELRKTALDRHLATLEPDFV